TSRRRGTVVILGDRLAEARPAGVVGREERKPFLFDPGEVEPPLIRGQKCVDVYEVLGARGGQFEYDQPLGRGDADRLAEALDRSGLIENVLIGWEDGF